MYGQVKQDTIGLKQPIGRDYNHIALQGMRGHLLQIKSFLMTFQPVLMLGDLRNRKGIPLLQPMKPCKFQAKMMAISIVLICM